MRLAYLIGWILLMLVGFGISPPNRPDLWPWLVRLMSGDWTGENPLVVAHFNLMGIWPLAMVALWRREWHRPGRLPAWPFLLGSFGLGCFALMPYAFLRREPQLGAPGVPVWVWGLLSAGFVGFLGWGLATGDVSGWLHLAKTDGFVFPMTWDFLAFVVLFAVESRGRLWGLRAAV